jgi:polar amino acid transport system permease protein
VSNFGANHFWFLLTTAKWTLILSAMAFVGGGIVGAFVVMARISPLGWLRTVALVYIQVIQGIPLLIQLFIWYFAISLFGANLSPMVSAAIALTMYSAAFFAEIWQASINAIPRGQWESASSLGLTRMQQLGWVIIPQAVRIAIPPTTGFLVQVIKNTSLAALIGFVELTRGGQLVNNATFQPGPAYLSVAAIYFAICFPLSLVSRKLERRLRVGRPTH